MNRIAHTWNRLLRSLYVKGDAGQPPAYGSIAALVRGDRAGNLTLTEATNSGFKSIVWVYRCIDAIARAVSSAPWYAYRIDDKGDSTPLPGHPLEKLLAKPNFYMDRRDFFYVWASHLGLAGEAYWEIAFANKVPYYLFPMRPDRVEPIKDPIEYVSGYKYKRDPNKIAVTLETQNVAWFKYVDPLDEYKGLSPLQSAQRTLKTESSAITWNQAIFDNSAMPSGVLKVPAGNLTEDQRLSLKKDMVEQWTRDNLGSPMLLWGGMDWQSISLAPKDLDFLEQRRLNKYEICAVYGVPPMMVGAIENPTYSNYSVARLSFWEDTITQLLDWLQSRINTQLAPYFGDGVQVGYDLSRVPAMREAFNQKVETAKTLWTMGWPINQINRRLELGLDPVAWGDTTFVNATQVPADALVAGATDPNRPGEREPADDEPDDGLDPYAPDADEPLELDSRSQVRRVRVRLR